MQSLEEKLTTKWYRDYSHKLHMQRLQEIKSHASKRIDNSVPKTKDSIVPQKQGKEFLKKEKKKSITKNNQQLLKILTEITAGKRETATQKILNSTRDVPLMKSLNITVRKKEARRIDEDNEELVRRLNDKKPGVSFKKLQEEWSIMNKYRESISKRGYRNGSSHLVSRLPPMNEFHDRSRNEEKSEENLSRTLGVIGSPKNRKKNRVFSVKQSQEKNEEIEELGENLRQKELNEGMKREDVDKEKHIEKKESIKLEDQSVGRESKKVVNIESFKDLEGNFDKVNKFEGEIKDKNEEGYELEKSKELEEGANVDEQSLSTKIVENKDFIEKNDESEENKENFDEKNEENILKEPIIIEVEQSLPSESVKTRDQLLIRHQEDDHKQESSDLPQDVISSDNPPQLNPPNPEVEKYIPESSSSKSEIPEEKASSSSKSSFKPNKNESEPQTDQIKEDPGLKTHENNLDFPSLELNP